jgi:hypothetical protein
MSTVVTPHILATCFMNDSDDRVDSHKATKREKQHRSSDRLCHPCTMITKDTSSSQVQQRYGADKLGARKVA